MNLSHIKNKILDRFEQRIMSIDSHTAGESTRLIVSGVGPLPGATVAEKRKYLMEHRDDIRRRLLREPRGHQDIFGAMVTEPCSEGASFGLIYMDPRYYPFLCGHATIGAVTTLIEAGVIDVSGTDHVVVVDTPSGPMETRARIGENDRVHFVSFDSVPSFVQDTKQPLEVPGLGVVEVDLVCVGGFFAMVSVDQPVLADYQFLPENHAKLVDLGMTIMEECNRQLSVRHPERPEVNTVDVTEFYHKSPSGNEGTGRVIYGERHMDRSPCGTGTTAKMALYHHLGLIGPDDIYSNSGPLGTTFKARVKKAAMVGQIPAVVVEISGAAHITGVHEFVLDPHDPFPEGFFL